jgi:predicted secreted Zn-dependent protease
VGETSIPNATVTYYDISGSTAEALRAQMDASGPIGDDGYRGDAITRWHIRWNWPGYNTRQCRVNQASVSYEITVLLPRWAPPDDIPFELTERWTNYINALVEHEKGHVDIVVANYLSVADAIQGATCETAEAAAQSAVDAIRQLHLSYDAETDHGATQGARFP